MVWHTSVTSRRFPAARGGVWLIGAAWLLLAPPAWGQPPADAQRRTAFFRQRIEPVLRAHCYECHSGSAETLEAGLRLDDPAALRQGGDSGPVLAPGEPDKSLVLQALRHENGLEMPPDMPRLPDAVIRDFQQWIANGAFDPRAPADTAEADPLHAARAHWAFQPVAAAPPPAVHADDWPQTPVDAFVLARLEARGWQPASPASPAEWVRRVTYDLTGLPPTPEEVADYTCDAAPDARERVVERLLASPRYGERFAQLWLDLVRYAETEGFEYDRLVPGAWRYRDYVIEAFNRDLTYDRFLTEQLAGDELADVEADNDAARRQAATILHRLGPVRRNAGNPEIALSRNEVLTERTNIVGDAFLGLTIGCARCHNHKLEPISQRDYYRLQAYFAATEEHDIVLVSDEQLHQWRRTTERIQGRIKQLQEQAKSASLDEQARLRREVEQLEATLPEPLPTIPAVHNVPSTRTPIHVLRRGVWELKGPHVGPRPPDVLVARSVPELPADAESPRSDLARWLTDRRHPLTARVMVNRLWQHHFGQGLVRTANDFGTHGDVPSHPELLDWLAAELMRHDWQLKPLHRLIVLSNTYAQSTAPTTHAAADPDNRLLWRFERRRLSADEIRDALLAVSGELNSRMGGPSVLVPVDEELVGLLYKPSQWQVTADPHEHRRRTVYLLAKRNLRLPFLEAFDSPALQTSCPRRETSTHAPQALELLNGPLANELARCLADRLRRDTGGQPERVVERAFQLTQGRSPTSDELRLSLEFLARQPLSEFALAVLNLNGFVYVP